MAYAIIRSGGKQFRVEEGATVRVPSLDKQAGDAVELEALVIGGEEVKVGSPAVEGATVKGTVVDHGRGDKIIVFKKKRRKQYKRTQGHRQNYTTVKIDSIG
ncbi:MAG TPA: 50S ribosomal protein L21 [Pyrinomonadaceae bacterium]|jgi:large subunit ribosomal protein L21|nr:50S ribosomal protein L21 [Pyrinomonadaceae bacterium]